VSDLWANDLQLPKITERLRFFVIQQRGIIWFLGLTPHFGYADARFRIYVNGEQVTAFNTRNDFAEDDDVNLSGNGHPFLIGQWNSSAMV
jgi:hypothetical protein